MKFANKLVTALRFLFTENASLDVPPNMEGYGENPLEEIEKDPVGHLNRCFYADNAKPARAFWDPSDEPQAIE